MVFESPSVAIEKGHSTGTCQTKKRNKTFYDIIYNLKTVLNISKYKIFMSVMIMYGVLSFEDNIKIFEDNIENAN